MMKSIVFTVTNDLTYDQRMIRICGTLADSGYDVMLVGRQEKDSIPITKQSFQQKRLHCWFPSGKLFYAEYNLRLLLFLLFKKADCVCAIDLDTILACYFASRIKRIPRVYDAHELFCEMKEVVTRAAVHRFWKRIEKFAVPRFSHAYTVNEFLASEFKKMYGSDVKVIRNLPRHQTLVIPEKKERYVLYQGAVNEGRSFETLIPAFTHIEIPFLVAGEGNFFEKCRELVRDAGLEHKVRFLGKIAPADLYHYTAG
ncbi:MAG TPA: glycosyltransferase, partial [Chitinophagaceae bacterium]